MLLQKRGGDVHIRAACARIRSGLGNSAAFDGKDDSKGEWHVALVVISVISDE
jgi:hypothetical protein